MAVSKAEIVEELIEKYGSDKLILGADAYNGKIASHGWQKESDLDVLDFIRSWQQKGFQYTICTDISMDGMLQGPAIDLYAEIIQQTKIDVIASGGISSTEDLDALETIGCSGAIIGKALYEGKISLNQLAARC